MKTLKTYKMRKRVCILVMKKFLACLMVLGMASMAHGALVVDFENVPPLPTGPSLWGPAGPMQTIIVPGFVTITGGVVLGNPTYFPAMAYCTPPNVYGTIDSVDPSLQPHIIIEIDPGFYVNEVHGVLCNGSTQPSDYLIEAYSGATVVDSQFFDDIPRNQDGGFGLISVANDWITRVVITPQNLSHWCFLVDTFTFIPESATVVDFNGDGKVDFKDFPILAQYWSGNESSVDIAPPPSGDGIVDFKDLGVFAENWLTGVMKASNPDPPDGALGVDIDTDLSWTAGAGATSHDVCFGTSSLGTFQGNQTATTFDTGTMAQNTTYHWRIDEVNPSGTTTGTVWRFTTIGLQASNPSPPDGSFIGNLDADLSWTAGPGAISHDVYFGTSSPPPFKRNQIAAIFDPGTMSYKTTYYWRIDEVNKWSTATGEIWSFVIMMPPPPPP